MFKIYVVLLTALFSFQSTFAAETVKINAEKSKLEWAGRKVTGEHHGIINLKSGALTFDGDKLSGGSFEIDMTTIVNHDLEDEAWNTKLVNHLKSDDFFSVEKYPVADFKITSLKTNEDGSYHVRGDLTIKEITKPIEFPATVELKDKMVKATANITVDRAKFNVRFGSGSFFENLGDKLIYDDFNMNVTLVADK